jgi:hypothetical protein
MALSASSLLRRSSIDGRFIGDDLLLWAFLPAIGMRTIVKPCQTVFIGPGTQPYDRSRIHCGGRSTGCALHHLHARM